MVILTIPLIDSSLDVNLYKVYNLPMLHPQLQIQVEYQLEGAYFATHMHGMYATIPKETDIKLCMLSQGHYCYIVGLGLDCKFIDLLIKHSINIFIKISLYLNFIVLEIISKQTDTLI